eukprot:TRINITY_DN7948_c0_g2_i1.p1 TRINITY_DN7948_c0_g2~~TRINITY_DN7948_c0_g2_i1.p1  ORF type:complete len:492 (+),score=159.00 TRINITY_DN7948_c0_g2_i1:785-2260(+)
MSGPFERVSVRARERGYDCLFGAVDCDQHFGYCEKHNATAFPVLNAWKGGFQASGPEGLAVDDLANATHMEELLWEKVTKTCKRYRAGASRCTQNSAIGAEWEYLETQAAAGTKKHAYDPTLDRDRVWPEDLLRALQRVLLAPLIDPPTEMDEPDRGPLQFLALAREAFPSASIREYLAAASANGTSVQDIARRLPVDPAQPWKGCSGSKGKYRGLTCAIWQLFHVLALQCAATPCHHAPLAVIRQWVAERFSCRVCRFHFNEGTRDWDIAGMTPKTQALVLWSFHNSVNARLAGDTTEDPERHKVQFPSRTACPECWDEVVMPRKEQVLRFLMKFYGVVNGSGEHAPAPEWPWATAVVLVAVLAVLAGLARAAVPARWLAPRRWLPAFPAGKADRADSALRARRMKEKGKAFTCDNIALPRVESRDEEDIEAGVVIQPSPRHNGQSSPRARAACSPRRTLERGRSGYTSISGNSSFRLAVSEHASGTDLL